MREHIGNRAEAGFTLLEVALGLALIAIIVMGFLTAITGSMDIDRYNRNSRAAVSAAKEVMEVARSQPFDTFYQSTRVGLDDDGDGRTDEEQWNLVDDDGDGRVDEDLSATGTWVLPQVERDVGANTAAPTGDLEITLLNEAQLTIMMGLEGSPVDLDGNGYDSALSAAPSADYKILPITVGARWTESARSGSHTGHMNFFSAVYKVER